MRQFSVHRAVILFMVTVYTVAEEMGKDSAVVHSDNTARPQTVSRKTNPRHGT
ncbi:MAG: hypothetical protein IPL01_22515 [Acidobacteria bacterium]|nr:hypothetical protein [Acidobacteriota bacterium]